ncbi:hypothetical protein ACQP25_44540 (plasmid) [Microtetraspora malaysiensis]|uniref:hypothetical protein n=1 Tax=Microtetraspora malaysiensis TaxID=161358 RepID=UPI003D8F6E11
METKRATLAELHTAAEHARAGHAVNGPGMRARAVTILEEAAAQYERCVWHDEPQCPKCDKAAEGCDGHAAELACDAPGCDKWLTRGDDLCTCYRQALMLARAINRLAPTPRPNRRNT